MIFKTCSDFIHFLWKLKVVVSVILVLYLHGTKTRFAA